jgi:divinyl chlorophyllide a 8-vinyl-reductase
LYGRCNPISESELAMFIVNSIGDRGMHNRVMDVGGPDEGLTPKEQAELLFAATGKEPNYIRVPIGLFDGIIGVIDFFAKFLPQAADAAELARIGAFGRVDHS